MGILRLDTEDRWAVDGGPIYPPSEIEYEDEAAVSADSGRLENGYMWKQWVRGDVRKVNLIYHAITGAELHDLKSRMLGRDFSFTYFDNGVKTISSAYASKCSYKGYRARMFPEEGGVYTDFKINVVEN